MATMQRATPETIAAIRAARDAEFDDAATAEGAATRATSRWSRNRKHSTPTEGEKRAGKREAQEAQIRQARQLFQKLATS